MGRCTTVVLLATCFISHGWAQTSPSPPPAEQARVAEPKPAPQTSTEAPWDKFKNFSARMTGGPVPGTADEVFIYRSGDKLRMSGPGKSYIVQDLAKEHDTRAISRIQCLQMKAPFIRSFPFSLSFPGNTYEHVPLGKETVDGHPTQVEELTITFAPAKKHPAPLKLKLWEAEDLQGFPIKIETERHRTMEYRNVSFEPLDPSLFTAPDECGVLDAQKDSEAPEKKPSGKKQPSGKSQ